MIKKIILLAAVLNGLTCFAYAEDSVVAEGKKVKMDYTLIVNKETLETSVGKQPLEFIYGDHTIIPGLEKGILGMKVGEEKEVNVEPKDGYGDVDPKALKEFPKDKMPSQPPLKIGMVLEAKSPQGETFPAVVDKIMDDKVLLDFNHPLAGKSLTFKIKILDIAPENKQTGPLLSKATK